MDVVRAEVPGTQMVLARVRSTGHDITLEEPERITVILPWAGRIRCSVRDGMTGADAGGVIAFDPNYRRTVVQRPGHGPLYLADVLTLPKAALIGAIRQEGLRLNPDGLWLDPAMQVVASLRRSISFVLTVAERPARRIAARAEERQKSLSAALLADLMTDLAAALSAPPMPERSAGSRRVALATEIMRHLYAEALSITELARGLGCSMRSLQVAFRECGLASPREVLGRIRLDAARIRLLSGAESVTEVALATGYFHFGRFAEAYRHRFGERPSETLAEGSTRR